MQDENEGPAKIPPQFDKDSFAVQSWTSSSFEDILYLIQLCLCRHFCRSIGTATKSDIYQRHIAAAVRVHGGGRSIQPAVVSFLIPE